MSLSTDDGEATDRQSVSVDAFVPQPAPASGPRAVTLASSVFLRFTDAVVEDDFLRFSTRGRAGNFVSICVIMGFFFFLRAWRSHPAWHMALYAAIAASGVAAIAAYAALVVSPQRRMAKEAERERRGAPPRAGGGGAGPF